MQVTSRWTPFSWYCWLFQNAYTGEDTEEPEFEYVPETPSRVLLPAGKDGGEGETALSPLLATAAASTSDPLTQSMLLLEESLDSGAIVGQFEQLYRRNPGLVMSVCHSDANVAKNRYRDISPYDSTRVVLSRCPTGDYINGNHVTMTIPGSGVVNRYVATQGPLSTTSIDFWYMAWELQSTLVIMLTTIVERGRIKCHKYWPDVGETVEFDGGLCVRCVKEDVRQNFAYRDFEMRMRKRKVKSTEKEPAVVEIVEAEVADALSGSQEDASSSETESKAASESEPEEDRHERDRGEREGGEEVAENGGHLEAEAELEDEGDEYEDEVRQITQMAYSSWPDHGVPEHSEEFVGFVEEVRQHREGGLHPTLVHCSAGIGRTGVLILMETAMCLIEANEPVFPLDLTRQMRDQRASMIQTPSQYRFVCDAIFRVYKDQRVKPLPEFGATAVRN